MQRSGWEHILNVHMCLLPSLAIFPGHLLVNERLIALARDTGSEDVIIWKRPQFLISDIRAGLMVAWVTQCAHCLNDGDLHYRKLEKTTTYEEG